jgi:endonuclease/exonuclease/phosphatase family metal-dependent hydrolase
MLVGFILISCGTSTEPKVDNNAPSDLVVYSNILDQVQLEWQDNSGSEIGFIIERKIFENDFLAIDTTEVNVNSYLDVNVETGNVYTYRISALFDDGISEYSNEVTIDLTSCSPTNLLAFCTANYEVLLNWEDRCSEETGFVIERKITGDQFTIIDTIAADLTTYLDENVEIGIEYIYRVAVIVESGMSAWSNEASVQVSVWFEGLEFGTDETLDIVTWNIENFPKANQTTVNYLTKLMLVIGAEIYALQEVEGEDYFESLLEQINLLDTDNDWIGYRSNSASYNVNLAYIYNQSSIHVFDITEIYTGSYSRPFPRRPLLMQMTFQDEQFWIIDNHLKASGDGIMNLSDPWDEETRRYEACNLLDEYISENLSDQKVIVLGDMNDELDDTQENNVFWTFVSTPAEYLFTDMEIAQGSNAYWSYPGWPSHLDHILITNELFEAFKNANSDCQTILVDEYLDNGWSEYDTYISDHRPVGIKLDLQ